MASDAVVRAQPFATAWQVVADWDSKMVQVLLLMLAQGVVLEVLAIRFDMWRHRRARGAAGRHKDNNELEESLLLRDPATAADEGVQAEIARVDGGQAEAAPPPRGSLTISHLKVCTLYRPSTSSRWPRACLTPCHPDTVSP